MKCMVLAGGSGDSLWPFSRKNYPKQFMNIKEGRSLFQEAIVRNMPFCDEFIIVTNENYKNIVNGQMKVFQSLRYRVILEGDSKGTGAAAILGSLFCNPSELILMVPSDDLIEGAEYKNAILKAKELAKEGNIVALTVKPIETLTSYDYLLCEGEDAIKLIEKINLKGSCNNVYSEGLLLNSGMYLFRAGDMINNAKNYMPELYNTCRVAKSRVPAIKRSVRFSENIMKDIPITSIEKLIFKRRKGVKAVEADIVWKDIGNVCDLDDKTMVTSTDYIIKEDCDNVTVINNAQKQLVVANDLKDLVIVNTEDAVYVSSKRNVEGVKDIIRDNRDRYESYFDYNRLSYREWGIHELINYSEGYTVKKVTVFPGMSMNLHKHEKRSEHWAIVEGTATITLGNQTRDYHKFENVFVPIGTKHKVANQTDKNVVIIETGIGESVFETDTTEIFTDSVRDISDNYVIAADNPIVKLAPAFKDSLWGGTNLRTRYGKECDYDVIGESWELSAHPEGQSRIAEGHYKEMFLSEYISIIGKEALGWKCQAQDRFPILIKFIDAKEALSVQLHPDDEYALENDNEYGKNEMWYVIDCEPDAYLYCGLSRDASKSEIQSRIADNTITDILNKVKVKPGDVVMVKAGTIHAIGAGILICEIQQNSNSTYRVYDYDRKDKFGNTRELHISKGMDVIDTSRYEIEATTDMLIEENEHYTLTRLVQCKYFECMKYEIIDEARILADDSSFVSVVFISGEGILKAEDFDAAVNYKAGDSFFVRAGKRTIVIKGTGTAIVTHV